jgi:hypothetical protein
MPSVRAPRLACLVVLLASIGTVYGVHDAHSALRQFVRRGKNTRTSGHGAGIGLRASRVVCNTTAGQLVVGLKQEWAPEGTKR